MMTKSGRRWRVGGRGVVFSRGGLVGELDDGRVLCDGSHDDGSLALDGVYGFESVSASVHDVVCERHRRGATDAALAVHKPARDARRGRAFQKTKHKSVEVLVRAGLSCTRFPGGIEASLRSNENADF